MRELRLRRKIWWRRLISPRSVDEYEWDGLSGRAVFPPQIQNRSGHRVADLFALSPVHVGWQRCKFLIQLRVECSLEGGIQSAQHVMRRDRCGRILRGCRWHSPQLDQIRLVRPVNGVNRVVYRGVHDREAPSWMHRRGLCALGANDDQQGPVPPDDWIDSRCRSPTLLRKGSTEITRHDHGPQHETDHRSHRYSPCLTPGGVCNTDVRFKFA